MRHARTLITFFCAALLTASCASSPNAAGGTAGSRYVVTEAELANVGDQSVYDALQQLRPSFLRSRDPQTSSNPVPTPVAVFINGGRTEGLDALRSIRASTVKEMRFYEPQDANTKFGTGHNGGVIEVTLK